MQTIFALRIYYSHPLGLMYLSKPILKQSLPRFGVEVFLHGRNIAGLLQFRGSLGVTFRNLLNVDLPFGCRDFRGRAHLGCNEEQGDSPNQDKDRSPCIQSEAEDLALHPASSFP